LLLIILVVFGVSWGLMVRFEVESRYDGQDFKISPIMGNMFLIKSGQWGKVRQVKFVLTPEAQDLYRSYDREGKLLASMNVAQNGMRTEIIVNYHRDFLHQIMTEKDRLNSDLLFYVCMTIENSSRKQNFCSNQVEKFIDWKNKYGLGGFVEFYKKNISLVKTAYAVGSCTGTVSCKAVGCSCSGTGDCPPDSEDGDMCQGGTGICECGCNGAEGTNMDCSGLSNQSSCTNAAPYDCEVGYCPVPDQMCTWDCETCGNFGACYSVNSGGVDSCVKSGTDNCGDCFADCTPADAGCNNQSCPTGCGYPGGSVNNGTLNGDCSCGTKTCPATEPCCTVTTPNTPVLSAPASGTIVNVNSAVTLDWDAISNWGTGCPLNSNCYEVCVMSDSTCDLLNWVSVGTTTYKAWRPTIGDDTVTWKVRSNNGSNTHESSPRTLCVEDQFCSPAGGQTRSGVFRLVNGATVYLLRIES